MTHIKTHVSYTAMIGATALIALSFIFTSIPAHASTLSDLSGRDLAKGMTGSDVASLQAVLSEQGYLQVPFGVPFGYYGNLTESALMRFQTVIGVPATGYYGSLTKERLTTYFSGRGWLTYLAFN